jgi:hypothetical protein
MRLFFTIIAIIGLFISLNVTTYGQDKTSFGFSGMYNFPLKTIGIGVRANIPIFERAYVVPQFKYAPSFNKIHELYAGVNLHYVIMQGNQYINGRKRATEPTIPSIYITGGVLYNRWINYTETVSTTAKQNNILPEIGLGTSIGGYAVRAFAEVKYNVRWNESYGEVGLLFCPYYIKQKRRYSCPSNY